MCLTVRINILDISYGKIIGRSLWTIGWNYREYNELCSERAKRNQNA